MEARPQNLEAKPGGETSPLYYIFSFLLPGAHPRSEKGVSELWAVVAKSLPTLPHIYAPPGWESEPPGPAYALKAGPVWG